MSNQRQPARVSMGGLSTLKVVHFKDREAVQATVEALRFVAKNTQKLTYFNLKVREFAF